MNRSLIVLIVAIIAVVGGAYFYITTRKDSVVDHMGKNQPIVQSHRSYEIEVTSNTDNVKPQQPITFTYKIKNDKGAILKNYEVAHEKTMHFIVVRKDLQNFQHLHPDFNQENGEFTVDVTFPTDGPYRVFPDFTPGEENPQKLPVTVFHDIDVGDRGKYKAEPVVPDTNPKKTVGEYQITYNFPTEMARNEINYSLAIEKNDQPVTDLQTYLGALGHSVILKEDTLNFIHTHAGETSTGPQIEFSTTFPESGVYKIFTQFQHQNKVVTTNYVVMVN